MEGTPYGDELLGMDAAAQYLGLSPYTFRTRWERDYKIPSTMVAGRRGFWKCDLDKFAQSRNQKQDLTTNRGYLNVVNSRGVA